jgi:3',5'-nucleoside bisphosphate phosphatase
LTESSNNFVGDFHLHSTCSDGILRPADLVKLAADNGVTVMSLSDHDSLEGIAEAQEACRLHGIKLIPGTEISTDIEGDEVHVLGHFMDPGDPKLQAFLSRARDGRYQRGEQIVARLNELGVEISFERVKEIAGDASIGRPHVAQALLERGYVATISDAFERYIGRNGPAYAERVKLEPEEAVRFIVEVGGIATFAHPQFTVTAAAVLPGLVEAGLTGIEVYYKDLAPDSPEFQQNLTWAKQYDLIPLGGTDYHGLNNPGERLPGQQVVPLPKESVDQLFTKAEELGRMHLIT